MTPSQVEINFGTPPGTTPRTSSDFEEIPYPFQHTQPHPWATSATQREETLPLHYMAEDTSARRRIARGPGSSGGFMSEDEQEKQTRYDDDGKDVYSKQRLATGRVNSGRIHKPYSPPPTSIVRPPPSSQHHLLLTDERPHARPNSSNKTRNTFHPRYTPSFHAGRAFIKSGSRTWWSGTRPTLASLGRTTSNASFISTFTHRWERCSLGSLVS